MGDTSHQLKDFLLFGISGNKSLCSGRYFTIKNKFEDLVLQKMKEAYEHRRYNIGDDAEFDLLYSEYRRSRV